MFAMISLGVGERSVSSVYPPAALIDFIQVIYSMSSWIGDGILFQDSLIFPNNNTYVLNRLDISKVY